VKPLDPALRLYRWRGQSGWLGTQHTPGSISDGEYPVCGVWPARGRGNQDGVQSRPDRAGPV